MKKFTIFMLIIFLLFAQNTIVYAEQTPNLPFDTYYYFGEVPHFFTHQLIYDTQKAFSDNNKLKNYYNNDLLTKEEFTKFLQIMYKNKYTLIDINDYLQYIKSNEKVGIKIYANRKPFLLSFDDMSFDTENDGLCEKIVLDENGKLASVCSCCDTKIVTQNSENICLLETFIEQNPLFSFNNARAVICPTGYNGVLGYRTNKNSYKNRETEIEKCNVIIKKLKEQNYHFACHTYNHIDIHNSNNYTIQQDLEKYKNEVSTLLDKTNLFCFPFGHKTFDYSKVDLLNTFGYNTFFCVDLKSEYIMDKSNIFIKRIVVDRHTIRENKDDYKKYFNVDDITN